MGWPIMIKPSLQPPCISSTTKKGCKNFKNYLLGSSFSCEIHCIIVFLEQQVVSQNQTNNLILRKAEDHLSSAEAGPRKPMYQCATFKI